MATDDPKTREQRRAQPPSARGTLSFFALRPWEWAVVGVVASIIVIVNKAVIHDRGNSWATLLVVAFFAGVALSHSARWVRRRH